MTINLIHVITGDDLICSICKEFLNTALQRDDDGNDDCINDDQDQHQVVDDDDDMDGRGIVILKRMSPSVTLSKTIDKSAHVDIMSDDNDGDSDSGDNDDNDCQKDTTTKESMTSHLAVDETKETGVVKQNDINDDNDGASHSGVISSSNMNDDDEDNEDEDEDSDDLIDRCAICGLSTEEADKLHFDTGDYYYHCYYYYYYYTY